MNSTPSQTETGAKSQLRQRRLPPWLKRPLGQGETYLQTARSVKTRRLHTVCEEARCPNRGECWSAGTATFMILGALCTRRCGFCSVASGRPRGEIDPDEPRRLADAVEAMGLSHVVITSVDRDDLPDKGAGHFRRCIRAIRQSKSETRIELLTPDFRRYQDEALGTLLPAAPLVWGHNVETVPRLYPAMRPGSNYQDSLSLLRKASAHPEIIAKSSIMLGVGETIPEVLRVFDDLCEAGVERLCVGQYLQPTANQLEVREYIHPEVFDRLAEEARRRGLRWVVAAPFARSSYRAEMPEPEPWDRDFNLANRTSIAVGGSATRKCQES